LLDDGVGHRLVHGDAGDLAHRVGAALQVLDVDCRVYVDAGVEQFQNILVAFGMARARRVAVCQFVNQRQLRAPSSRASMSISSSMAPRYSIFLRGTMDKAVQQFLRFQHVHVSLQ